MRLRHLHHNNTIGLYQLESAFEVESVLNLFFHSPSDIKESETKRKEFISLLQGLFHGLSVVRNERTWGSHSNQPFYLEPATAFNNLSLQGLERKFLSIGVKLPVMKEEGDMGRLIIGILQNATPETIFATFDIAAAYGPHPPQDFGPYPVRYRHSFIDDIVDILGKGLTPSIRAPRVDASLSRGAKSVATFIPEFIYGEQIRHIYNRAREIAEAPTGHNMWSYKEWELVRRRQHSEDPVERTTATSAYRAKLAELILDSGSFFEH